MPWRKNTSTRESREEAFRTLASQPIETSNTTGDAVNKRGRKSRRSHWGWPLSLAVAGFGSAAAAILLSGCRHSKMSWPMKTEHGDFSYQVCTNCGIKRLYDEEEFRPYGPFGYDLHELMATERLRRQQKAERASKAKQRSAPKTA